MTYLTERSEWFERSEEPELLERSRLSKRLQQVRERISVAARSAGRNPEQIKLVVITKFQELGLIKELLALGVIYFGESRHQEALLKAEALRATPAEWHFVGQLQSNKAKRARDYIDTLHSLDRESLLVALATPLVALATSAPVALNCFIQVNFEQNGQRGGVAPEQLARFAELVLQKPEVKLRGLMTVPPLGAVPRDIFSRLRELGEQLQRIDSSAIELSMGMSSDFEAAIAEGATHLRIGSAITGNRVTAG